MRAPWRPAGTRRARPRRGGDGSCGHSEVRPLVDLTPEPRVGFLVSLPVVAVAVPLWAEDVAGPTAREHPIPARPTLAVAQVEVAHASSQSSQHRGTTCRAWTFVLGR